MDSMLFEYLISGKAWLLIGSGPSIEMGYPSWRRIAEVAIQTIKTEQPKTDCSSIEADLAKQNYPAVFEKAKTELGYPQLIYTMRQIMNSSKTSKLYEIIAKWPIPVYMTTNYDDEINHYLVNIGLSYTNYTNSRDHMSQLNPDLNGAIVKLHGDLRSEQGLILTTNDYHSIMEEMEWEHWRITMAAVFQMNRVIVIGHSLSDKNIQDVLRIAQKGASFERPIIWITPDNIPTRERNEFAQKHRIRLITYNNDDGLHTNLVRLLDSVSQCIPPRTIIHLQEEIQLSGTATLSHPSAPGFFVFNQILKSTDYEQTRINIITSAIEAALPDLYTRQSFTIEDAIRSVGWPRDLMLEPKLATELIKNLLASGLIEDFNGRYKVPKDALEKTRGKKLTFETARDRFQQALVLRIRRDFPELTADQTTRLSHDIDSSLTAYFEQAGLTVASLLFQKQLKRLLPMSLVSVIIVESTRYDDWTMRLAFFKQLTFLLQLKQLSVSTFRESRKASSLFMH